MAALIGGCKKEKEPEKVVVKMEKAGTDNVEIYGEYVGRIRARQFVEVRARVEGYLENMLFEEGKRVERNQPLFIINRAQYKARADKADAQLKKDLAQEAKAERDVQRLRPLYVQKAASQLDLDNAIAAYESARASVAMSRADLAQANLELGYTTVRSPISGYISERYVDIGTLVVRGQNLYWRQLWKVMSFWSISVLRLRIISGVYSEMLNWEKKIPVVPGSLTLL